MIAPIQARTSLKYPLVTVLVLLLSALSISSLAAPRLSADEVTPQRDDLQEDSQELEWAANSWDWSCYADEAGYVDVILIASEYGQSEPQSDDWLSALVRTESAANPSVLVGALEQGMKEKYSRVFCGMSARLQVDTIEALQIQSPWVRAFPDFEVAVTAGENIRQVGADQVWAYQDGSGNPVKGSGIVVAVIDTGIYYTHPDLGAGFGPGHKVIGGYDFVNDDADPIDDNGHGTHVAGTIAASGGISGVAPEASLLAYKVLDKYGSGDASDVIAGIDAAMDPNGDGDLSDRADVISMSLGGLGTQGDPLCLAVRNAVEEGIVVVVAAGNSGPSMGAVASPGIEPEAITVGAVDSVGNLADFSSRGLTASSLIKPEICAPGVDVVSTVPYSGTQYCSSSGYLPLSGTSMATPHVSGVTALLLQLHPEWTPDQVKSAIVTGSNLMDEPLWHAGAGALWAPSAANTDVFVSEPIVCYGELSSETESMTVTNTGSGSTFTLTASDWHSLWYDGSASDIYWVNASTVEPAQLEIPSGGTASASLVVVSPDESSPEGFYEGAIHISDASRDVRVPFGYIVLSHLNVHVLNIQDREVFDPRGGVFVYSHPGADIYAAKPSTQADSSPPASFVLPSGTYSVHALGHQLFYAFSDPYVLSCEVVLGRLQTADVYLRMTDARQMTMDLTTEDGNPIFVKDFLLFCRYVGNINVSHQVLASETSTMGSGVFSLPTSKKLYVSDTDAMVGISAAGFSYSSGMWEFMNRNWQHWYEYSGSTSTDFLIQSTADLQYLLSWEFHGVDSNSPVDLGVDPSSCSVFDTKYDIMGSIESAWGGGGGHLSMGADATPYLRRATYTSLNPFFSGMTRKTIVQGVFSEFYWPGSISDGYVEPEFYVPDYGHRVKTVDVPNVYLIDRNFITPIEGLYDSVRIGAGPVYPSVRMMNSGSAIMLIYPLLRDQGGARVASPDTPWLYLYRSGSYVGSFNLVEHLANPEPIREIPITIGGSFRARMSTSLHSQVSSSSSIVLGFTIPSSDMNPPTVTGLAMPQRFVPGEVIPLEVSVADDASLGGIALYWKPSGGDTWQVLPNEDLGFGRYAASIQTSLSDRSIDFRLNVTDSSGNYLDYSTVNASMKQVSVSFDLSFDTQDIDYVDGDASILVTGHLTDENGNPLHTTAAVPIDFMVDGKKVAMILDEYVEQGSHNHNGTIRFDWHFNPAQLFSEDNQTIEICADLDLGTYQPVSERLYLHSMKVGNGAPVIRLLSPGNGSIVAAGQFVDLSIWDDGSFYADACLDDAFLCHLSSPWDIDTSSWSDGSHVLEIVATDVEGLTSTATFDFDIDALAPSVTILYPADGGHILQNSILRAEISDNHLSATWYSVDNQPAISLSAPYEVNMSGWVPGYHTVDVRATDTVGHIASANVSFVITWGSIVVDVLSPQNYSVIHSGVPIVVSVSGDGEITAKWSEYGVWHDLGGNGTIATTGWSEGLHQIIINATNDLGEFDGYDFSIVIDDSPPEIVLESPANNSFVEMTDEIRLRITDANLQSTFYMLWNLSESGAVAEITIPLSSSPCDGRFELFVSSFDRAGNMAEASFSFAMDSSPPAVFVDGLNPGDAIKPGRTISVAAVDVFLSAVQWSLDEESFQMLESPYEISTGGVSEGWHEIRIIASDLSGKHSILNLSLYVDMTAPSVQIMPLRTTDTASNLDVMATVVDDYAVGNVTLYYELQEGGYGTIAMVLNGTSYVAELIIDILWDGMTIYVVAEDTVGNLGESSHVTLAAEGLPDNSRDDSPRGGPASWHWLGTQGGLLTLGFIAAASILTSVFMISRRRSLAEKASDEPSTFGPMHETIRVTPPSVERPISVTSVPAVSAASGPLQGAKPSQVAAAKPVHKMGRTTLIDVIPELAIKPVGIPTGDPEDDIDYGEMIERELDFSALKKSVFREDIRDEDVDMELESLFGGPQIVSGLRLKKLMDLDTQKM